MSEMAYIIGGITGVLIFLSMVLRFFFRQSTKPVRKPTSQSPLFPSRENKNQADQKSLHLTASEKHDFEPNVVCQGCGTQNKLGDNFCGGCGSALPKVAQSMKQIQIENAASSLNKVLEKSDGTATTELADELKMPLEDKNHTASETVSTIYCPKCGRANDPDLIYCKYDLAVLYPGSQQCPKCRRSIPVNTRFCVHCGTHVPK